MSFDTFIDTFTGKNVLIFGFGRLGGGLGTLQTFQYFDCSIRITDQKTESELSDVLSKVQQTNIDAIVLGKHSQEDIDWADVIVKNPAVPSTHPLLVYALKRNKYITSDAALFVKYTQSKTVGITGTRGKTTTTLLTHHLLSQTLHSQVLLGGNLKDIGTLPLLTEEKSESISVLELSSFALESFQTEMISPHIAAITNIYPDHLDRYDSVESYAQAKAAIFLYQKPDEIVLLNQENEWTDHFSSQAPSIVLRVTPTLYPEILSHTQLRGKHNAWNCAFAITIAKHCGVNEEQIIQSMQSFTGAPYRQQVVGEWQGKRFINDSTSTTPEAVIAALDSFPDAAVIIGGTTKKLPLEKLATHINGYQGEILFLNSSGTQELMKLLKKEYPMFDTLQDAFAASLHSSKRTILFSPGFTSFELFKNEFDRAEQFDKLVDQLKKKEQ